MAAFQRVRWREKAELLRARLAAAETAHIGVLGGFFHIDYSPLYDEFWQTLEEANIGVVAEDWMVWSEQTHCADWRPASIGTLSLQDAARYAPATRRAERFVAGVFLDRFENGCVTALLARLIQLIDQLPYESSVAGSR
jgi:glyoxylate carboligase